MSEEKKKIPAMSITIQDKEALYAAYMPFLTRGGLFIPTNKTYQLGEKAHLMITLMDEVEKFDVKGTIVWITPKRAHGVSGIGVEFSDQASHLQNKIETYLAGMLERDLPTHTM